MIDEESVTSVLVTGASGFVGGHIVCQLAKAGLQTIAVGNTKVCAEPVVRAATVMCSIDITDKEEVARVLLKHRPTIVVHAAAMAKPNDCEVNAERAEMVNVQGTKNLLQACEALGCGFKGFIYLSTDLVFDGKEAPVGGFVEEVEPSPISVYAKTKVSAENAVIESGIAAAVFRLSLVYGPPIGENTGFLGWLTEGLKQGKAVKLFTDEFRTPVFVQDIATAILLQIQNWHMQAGISAQHVTETSILHIAGAERLSRLEFGLKLTSIYGLKASLLEPCLRADVPTPAPRAKDVSLNIKASQIALGISFCRVEDGLRKIKEMGK